MRRGEWAPSLPKREKPWCRESSSPSRTNFGEGPDMWRREHNEDELPRDLILKQSGNEIERYSWWPK